MTNNLVKTVPQVDDECKIDAFGLANRAVDTADFFIVKRPQHSPCPIRVLVDFDFLPELTEFAI